MRPSRDDPLGMLLEPVSDSNASQDAVLLVNTRSLKGQEWLNHAKDVLTERGVRLTVAEGFSKAPELFERAKKEIAPGRLIIVGGGDGTMNAIANLIHNSGAIMGVLPLGTGNAFARDLGIQTDIDKAVEVLTSGQVAEVDLGLCENKVFLNVVTIGLTTKIAQTLTVPLKRRFGRFVYAIAIAKALREMEQFHVRIQTENGDIELNTVQLVIGNGHYHAGPLPLSPTSAITSGRLRLYAVENSSRASLLKYALLLPTGLQGILKEVHSQHTTGGYIVADPAQVTIIDGEIGQTTPFRFSIEPQALKVMAPKDFRG